MVLLLHLFMVSMHEYTCARMLVNHGIQVEVRRQFAEFGSFIVWVPRIKLSIRFS